MTLLVVFAAFCIWRDWRVRSIPDVGEPFDVEAFYAEYDPNAENAFDHYQKWIATYRTLSESNWYANVNYDIATDSWSNASEPTMEYVKKMRPLLEPWRLGSEVEQGYEIDPRDIVFESLLSTTQDYREYVRIQLLETSRLMHEGHHTAVFDGYQQLLRTNAHIRNGCLISQLVGFATYKLWYAQLELFLARDDIPVEELKTFLEDLRRLHEGLPKPRVALHFEYLSIRRSLQPMIDTHGWRNDLTRESEVFERVLNLFYAHWLKYYEVPPWEAPPLVTHSCATSQLSQWLASSRPDCTRRYFDDGAESEALVTAYHQLSYTQKYLNEFIPAMHLQPGYERTHEDRLFQQMAELQLSMHIYYREHGHFPETLETLVPEYIDELPRTPDVDGKVLTYEQDKNGIEMKTSDGKHSFYIYAPGTKFEEMTESEPEGSILID